MFVFIVSLPAVTPRFYSADEVQYFSYLRSLWFDHDVSFENEYRYFYDNNIAQSGGFHETFLVRETAAGRRVNYGTIGCALLWAPLYAVADLWTRATGGIADGYSRAYVRAATFASAFYGFVAILLSIRAARIVLCGPDARQRCGEFDATFWAGVAIWLGTPLLFYMYVAPPFAHATSAFAAAVFVSVWLHVRRRWSPAGTFALGVSAAVMAMVREQDIFLVLGPIFDGGLAALTPNSDRLRQGYGESAEALRAKAELLTPKLRRFIQAAVAGGVGFLLAYSPQLFAYNALNGYPGPAAHVARKMYWYSPHGLQVLFSTHHGFVFWTPLAVLAIGGLVLLAVRRRDERRIALGALVMVLSQVYIAGSVASWTVAGAFGQRRFICLTAVLVLGLAGLRHAWLHGRSTDVASVVRQRPYRGVAVVAVALCVWWNVALMAQFATNLMDRQRLELGKNAYHAFVTLPRTAPALAYRYFTDRSSFYQNKPVSNGSR